MIGFLTFLEFGMSSCQTTLLQNYLRIIQCFIEGWHCARQLRCQGDLRYGALVEVLNVVCIIEHPIFATMYFATSYSIRPQRLSR